MLTEHLDSEGRESFDKKLVADPSAKPANPYEGGSNRNVLALMAAARMPQAAGFSNPGADYHPKDKRG